VAKKSQTLEAIEYGALRVAGALVNALPYAVASALVSFCGWFACSVVRLHRRRTLSRLEAVFPERTDRERRRIARLSLTNVLMTAVEMMRAPRLGRAWMDRRVVDGARHAARLEALAAEGRGVVVMVPHSGNWYMAAWAMAVYGVRLCAIAARQRNARIDAWLKRQYGSIDVLDRGSARTLSEIVRRLREGRVFAILPDVRVPQKDVDVPFLGGRANVSHGGAFFAVKSGAPVVVATMRREKGRHVFEWLGTLRPDPAATDERAEAARLTREAMALFDASIRAHPEHWYWYNKRWILQPVARPKRRGKGARACTS
jgi:KDO2-lipid IV(A) lauroyltransferase